MVTTSMLLWETLEQIPISRGQGIHEKVHEPEKMNHVELGQIVQAEKTVRETHHQQVGCCVERSAVNFSIVLHEEVLLHNSPSGFRNVLVRFRVFLGHILPAEKGSVLADGVDLQAVLEQVNKTRPIAGLTFSCSESKYAATTPCR
jgi:hypothetical protein